MFRKKPKSHSNTINMKFDSGEGKVGFFLHDKTDNKEAWLEYNPIGTLGNIQEYKDLQKFDDAKRLEEIKKEIDEAYVRKEEIKKKNKEELMNKYDKKVQKLFKDWIKTKKEDFKNVPFGKNEIKDIQISDEDGENMADFIMNKDINATDFYNNFWVPSMNGLWMGWLERKRREITKDPNHAIKEVENFKQKMIVLAKSKDAATQRLMARVKGVTGGGRRKRRRRTIKRKSRKKRKSKRRRKRKTKRRKRRR